MSVNSIRNLLEIAAQTEPEKIGLMHGSEAYSYAELITKVDQIAHYLTTIGLKKGSRIGIYSNKRCEQVIAILAVLSTEYVFVPITRLLKPEQVKHIIDDSGISCLITDKIKIENIKAIDFKGKIISYEASDESDVSFEEIYKCYTADVKCEIKGNDNAAITYSFGSSGNPKGIVIDHRAFIDGARIVSKYLDICKDDIISGILSFNLDYGLNQIFVTLYKRATLAIHKFVLPSDFFSHLINEKITVLPLMPIHITQMFDEDPHRIPQPEHFKNLRTITSSGGNITPLMVKNITTHFPDAKFYSMHGLIEAFRSAFLDPSQIHIRPNSIGKAIPDVELYIINEEGEACKPREIGELIHRGACIYKGYWNAPEETAQRFKSIAILDKVIEPEGQLTDEIVIASGDYVYADEEGYIYFVSRKDDMIKTQGYRVSPHEIESVVYDNIPEITECAVFSVPNAEIEEEIIMVYGAKSELARNEILFELKKHLPNYMLPGDIVYKKSMPLKSLHEKQIDKEVLRREFLR
ncbi:MAG: AMP-dependent synthetase [Epsilonproteobacteria bacterium 4484_65]|nr:MAG: AMP-dependent synthetase [Epsilonproteobacteria bacterium 4484_65]